MTWLCEHGWWPAGATENLKRLLGHESGDFPDGRVSILVCPIDADLGCGALSVELVMGTETVEWRDLAWQADYEPLAPGEDLLEPPQSYRFRRAEYVELLGELLAHFQALADEERAARASIAEPDKPEKTRTFRWWPRRS